MVKKGALINPADLGSPAVLINPADLGRISNALLLPEAGKE